jgi:L-methionine (R)-S-oxide reductase
LLILKQIMAEELKITGTTKEELYHSLIPQIKALVKDENDLIANLSNIAAALKQTFDFLWIGFYLVKNNELVLGPFQGPVACTRIAYGKGVCGTAWKNSKTIVVEDVDKFPGHIACSSDSKSEIVIPLYDRSGCIIGVLDVDDSRYAYFGEMDKLNLERVASIITELL